MSSNSKVTGGPWTHHVAYRIDSEYGRIPLIIQRDGEGTIAEMGVDFHDDAIWANAYLITTAVNSCFTISPSDPQAAAEAYPEVVAALKAILGVDNPAVPDLGHVDYRRAVAMGMKALAKVGR